MCPSVVVYAVDHIVAPSPSNNTRKICIWICAWNNYVSYTLVCVHFIVLTMYVSSCSILRHFPVRHFQSVIFQSCKFSYPCHRLWKTTSLSRLFTITNTYSVSQKVYSPLKLFATFLLRLSIFPRNFASMLPVYIYTNSPILFELS